MAKLKAKKTKTNKNQIQGNKKEDENVVVLPPVRMSDDPTPKQVKTLSFFSLNRVNLINNMMIYLLCTKERTLLITS